MKHLSRIWILSTCALIFFVNRGAVEASTCAPGSVSYALAHQRGLSQFASDPTNLATNSTAGRLSVSSTLEDVTATRVGGYSLRLVVRSTYGSVANRFGLVVRTVTYFLDTNAACDDFVISSIAADPPLPIGTPDIDLSAALASGFNEYLRLADTIPTNRHLGDHSIRVHGPVVCRNGKSASVNLVRAHHTTTGLTYRTTSYLVELGSGQKLNSTVRPGRLLQSMCL